MSTILEHLLHAHLEAGGFAMPMSATLGSTACRWLGQENLPPLVEAIDKTPYPAVSTPEGITTAGENGHAKTITIAARAMMSDFSDTARHALQAARAGAKVLVIRNTVGYAVETHQALEALAGHEDGELLFRVKGVTTLHHGRFAADDRRLIDDHPKWRIPAMNRELVERATRPDLLASITDDLGEAWQAHANSTEGGYVGERQIARGNLVRLDKSFFDDNRDVMFASAEERIRTRLGDDRVEVAFDPLPVSPFDPPREIDKLAVSADWLKGEDVPETVETTASEGGFDFNVGDGKFRYDRQGLHRA